MMVMMSAVAPRACVTGSTQNISWESARCCWLCFANKEGPAVCGSGKDHVSGAIATRSVVLINLI